MIDEGFIRRTYRTTVVVWAIAVFTCLAFQQSYAAMGLTIGTAVGLGILASLDRVVRRVFVPGNRSAGKAFAKYGAIKLLVVVAVIIAVVLTKRFDLIVGFCAGVGLTQAIMFLKVVGMSLNKRMGL